MLAGFAAHIGPGRNEVVLNHSDPAVVGLCHMTGLVADVVKRNLLELVFFGVDRRARVGVVEGALAFRLVAVAGQLIVDRRTDSRFAVVNKFVADCDRVATVREFVVLANRDVVDRAFESSRIDVDFTPKFLVHALFGLGADVLEQRLVVGKITANKAALRHIDALGRNGEKLNIGTSGRFLAENHAGDTDFSPIGLLMLFQKHGMRDNASDFVNRKLEHVVADFNRSLDIDHALSNRFGTAANGLRHTVGSVIALSRISRLLGLRGCRFSEK